MDVRNLGKPENKRHEFMQTAALKAIEDRGLPITAENFAEFISMIYNGEISSKIAKMVLKQMLLTAADPSEIIKEKGLVQITDQKEIEKIVKQVIKNNPGPVGDYQKGKETAIQFLIGQVMAQSKGKANPQTVNKLLRELL